MKEKLLTFLQTKKGKWSIAGIVGVVFCIIVASVYALSSTTNKNSILKLKDKEIFLEYGEGLSTKATDFLDVTGLKQDQVKDIDKNAKISPSPTDKVLEVGTYDFSISYKNEKAKGKLTVADTTAPSFDTSDNLTVPLGTVIEDFKTYFIVKDQSEFEITVDAGGYDANVEGTYTIMAIAIDKYKNKATYSFSITVSKDVNEVVSSENDTKVEVDIPKENKDKHNQTSGNSTSSTNSNNSSSSNNGGNTSNNNSSSGNNSGGNTAINVNSVSLDIAQTTIMMQTDDVEIKAIPNPTNASNIGYSWSVSNSNVINLWGMPDSQSRLVGAKNPGTSVITVTCGGKSASVTITVIPWSDNQKPSGPAGNPKDFKAVIRRADGKGDVPGQLIWTSANTAEITMPCAYDGGPYGSVTSVGFELIIPPEWKLYDGYNTRSTMQTIGPASSTGEYHDGAGNKVFITQHPLTSPNITMEQYIANFT